MHNLSSVCCRGNWNHDLSGMSTHSMGTTSLKNLLLTIQTTSCLLLRLVNIMSQSILVGTCMEEGLIVLQNIVHVLKETLTKWICWLWCWQLLWTVCTSVFTTLMESGTHMAMVNVHVWCTLLTWVKWLSSLWSTYSQYQSLCLPSH